MNSRELHPLQQALFNVITSNDEKLTPDIRLERVRLILKAIQDANDLRISVKQKEKEICDKLYQVLDNPSLKNFENKVEDDDLISLNVRDKRGETLLRYAMVVDVKIFTALLEAKADLEYVNSQGYSPLMQALARIQSDNDFTSSEIILNRKMIDLNSIAGSPTYIFHTVLTNFSHAATLQGGYFPKTVKFLIKAKADLELPDKEYGETPLSWACDRDNFEVVQILLEARANVNSIDKVGDSIIENICLRTEREPYSLNKNKLSLISLLIHQDAIIRNPKKFYEFLNNEDQRDPNVLFCFKALLEQQAEVKENNILPANQLTSAQIKDVANYLQKLTVLNDMYKTTIEAEASQELKKIMPEPVSKIITSYSHVLQDQVGFFKPSEINKVLEDAKKLKVTPRFKK